MAQNAARMPSCLKTQSNTFGLIPSLSSVPFLPASSLARKNPLAHDVTLVPLSPSSFCYLLTRRTLGADSFTKHLNRHQRFAWIPSDCFSLTVACITNYRTVPIIECSGVKKEYGEMRRLRGLQPRMVSSSFCFS